MEDKTGLQASIFFPDKDTVNIGSVKPGIMAALHHDVLGTS